MKNGYSLVELMVVVAILGILSAIGSPLITGQAVQSVETNNIEDVNLD